MNIARACAATVILIAVQTQLTGCLGPDLTSGLGIPAGETFTLGGEQQGSYRAKVHNHGETTVTLLTSTGGNEPFPIAVLEPGDRDELRMGPAAPLLLRNESNVSDAALKVEVFGETSLAMYYTLNEEGAQ
ncbi:MAG: hypothetical protein AAFX05_07480 [Planctomycetota bacterium]